MKIKKIIICLLIMSMGLCGVVQAADMGILIKNGDFENGIDGFGIAYSSRNDTSLPYIFMSSDITSSGNGSLKFVCSETLGESESLSPQSLGFAYQGIYNTDYISVESGRSYTVSADFYTESSGVKMRFIEMDGNKAVAASDEITLAAGVWQTESYKWEADRTTDRNRVRAVFYNIEKNESVYIDNFVYSGDFISDSSWKPDKNGTISKAENGFSYTASANSFKDYSGVYASIDKISLDENKKYVLSGYVDTDMQEAALYISADNIDNCFAQYQITAGNRAYVTLEFDPSECFENDIKLSITATGTTAGKSAVINFSDLKISETDTLMKIEQKNNNLYIFGNLRKGNENRELKISVTGLDEFTAISGENGEYSITCSLPYIQTSREIFVTISNVNGYSDCGGVINGYTTVYNEDYRNTVAKNADEKTTVSEIKAVLTDEVLKDIGISKIRNYRMADKDFVFKDTNKWTRVLGAQTLSIESVSAGGVTASTQGSTKMLSVAADTSADNLNAHVTAKIKLSKLDIVPGKKYEISFRAFGDQMPRALYIGLLNHQDATVPSAFTGSTDTKYNKYAGGIIDYEGKDYTTNRVAVMTKSWQEYTHTIEPTEASFDNDGFADLYFVMTGDKTLDGSTWNSTDMLMGEKLYLDEIEITEAAASDLSVLVNDGLYTKRATFESDNMDMFSPQARASVVLTDADANTGSYCAEFSNRVDNWTSLGSSIKGADLTSSVTASCYLKKNSLKL